MFTLNKVSKKYGEEYALKDVSFNLGKGMNVVLGPSGSGKTTLLKILSGMDNAYEGSVEYDGKNLKTLSAKERARYYNQVFGFVWQDFNLIDNRSVLENVQLPLSLNGASSSGRVEQALKEMKVGNLAHKQVRHLSGGQKQRVAIARELVKNPQVIFADEPTSALDKVSAKTIMKILNGLARTRTVVVVTHDTSLIGNKAQVFKLDKGELESAPQGGKASAARSEKEKLPRLSPLNALRLGLVSLRRGLGHSVSLLLAALLSGMLLLTALGSSVSNAGQSSFDKLYQSYGDQLLDVQLFSSFINAGQGDGKKSDDPKVDVNQDLSGLYDRYNKDDRVALVLLPQAFGDIKVNFGGKDYPVSSSNNVPVMDKLLAGSMPEGEENQVAIPESLAKSMGLSDTEALGKEIYFTGTLNNWSGGSATPKPVSIHATISGVFSPDMVQQVGGKINRIPIEDSFFFSGAALQNMRTQAGLNSSTSLYLRAKTPQDMISLKDELNASGIVPTGHFELVENLVKMNTQTSEQTGSATLIIGLLSLVVVAAVALLGAVLRKRSFAIYKVSGFNAKQLVAVCAGEFTLFWVLASVVFLVLSPLMSQVTLALWNASLLDGKLLGLSIGVMAGLALLSGIITALVASCTKVSRTLKAGDR